MVWKGASRRFGCRRRHGGRGFTLIELLVVISMGKPLRGCRLA